MLVAYAIVFSAIAVRWFRWGVERSETRRLAIPALLMHSIKQSTGSR